MRQYLKAVAVAAALVSGTPASAGEADWSSPVVGGRGGTSAALRCPAGSYLAGVVARIGDDMDAIGPICAQALTTGGIYPAGRPGTLGGTGGRLREFACPASAPFVRKATIGAEGSRTIVVNSIEIRCGPLSGPMPQPVLEYNYVLLSGPNYYSSSLLPGTGGNSLSYSNLAECPSHMAPVGLHGRAGAMVDALGIICGEIALVKPKALGKVRPAEKPPLVNATPGLTRQEAIRVPTAKPLGKVRPASPAGDPPICQRARSARGHFNAATQAALDAQCRNAGGNPN
ncbi:hypothetical protein LZK98_14840 [Sphingomonas cannabina]|uniref:hypothetical protein n=1 Tax=Sphingomonas cannabina TaxID=2899123 RepID=UPI001F1C7979|nr:hypothetical protein [Sphingomonas cannabina]UIJ44336.1 hypothetical protein LZK98_14840 [Sphingomonas cannabina]